MSRPMGYLYFTTKTGLDLVVREMLTPDWIKMFRPVVFKVNVEGLEFETSDAFDYEYMIDRFIPCDRMRCVGYLKNK